MSNMYKLKVSGKVVKALPPSLLHHVGMVDRTTEPVSPLHKGDVIDLRLPHYQQVTNLLVEFNELMYKQCVASVHSFEPI